MRESAVRNRSERKSPARSAIVGWLFFFVLLVAVISAGISIGLGYSPRPRAFGWVLFVAGLIVAILTVYRWAQVLPGIFGVATLNGLIVLISGHALNQPAIPVPRLVAVLFTMVMADATVMLAGLESRDVTNIDRAAYLGTMSCFVAMMFCVINSVGHWELPVCIGFIVCMAVLWTRKFWSGGNRRV